MTVNEFVGELGLISLPNVFNPYRDVCPFSDHVASPSLRRQNLTLFLNTILKREVRSVWLGRDLGYRGGRRTGIALTDEFHLDVLKDTFGVFGIVKATIDKEPIKERTATEIWKVLSRIGEPVLLWNVFPFHPFDEGDPRSNRRHTAQEFNSSRDILISVLEWLKPVTVIALGADAESAVLSLGKKCRRVRHPSYGGQMDFSREIYEIYQISQSLASETSD
jgi:uracil DNA glycosylase superfamily protein